MKKIGFIGLGVMGKPMAKNLLKAGYALKVYDIVPEPVKEVVAAGAQEGTSSQRCGRVWRSDYHDAPEFT